MRNLKLKLLVTRLAWWSVLVVLFGAYIWKKTTEISELKGLVVDSITRMSLPSDRQLDSFSR